MKSLKISFIVALTLGIFLCGGVVSALNADQASAAAYWSSDIIYPGETLVVRITFSSNIAEPLQLGAIGVHLDWMEEGLFIGPTLSETVPGYGNYTSDPIIFQVPANVSAGAHSYTIAVDGNQSGSEFSWDSATMQLGSGNITPKPSVTPSPGGGQTGGSPSWLLIVEIVAVAAIVIAVVVILLEVRKSRKQPNPVPSTTQNAPTPEVKKE